MSTDGMLEGEVSTTGMRFAEFLFVTACLSSVIQFGIVAMSLSTGRGGVLFAFVLATHSLGSTFGIWVALVARMSVRRFSVLASFTALVAACDFICCFQGALTAFVVPMLIQAGGTAIVLGSVRVLTTAIGRVVLCPTEVKHSEFVDQVIPNWLKTFSAYTALCPWWLICACLAISIGVLVATIPRSLSEMFISVEMVCLALPVAVISTAVVVLILTARQVVFRLITSFLLIAAAALGLVHAGESSTRDAIVLATSVSFAIAFPLAVVRVAGFRLGWERRSQE